MTDRVNHSGRIFEFDFIRTVSMLFVIAIHAFGVVDASSRAGSVYLGLMQPVCRTCNGMFFMLSGYFALRPSKKSYGEYYRGKFASIGIPILFFFFLRTAYQGVRGELHASLPVAFLYNLLGDFIFVEYWYIFVIVSYLLIAPLLAKAFANFTRKEHFLFIALAVFHNGLATLVKDLGFPYAYLYTFGDWFLYFYLGFALAELIKGEREHVLLWILGICSLAGTILLAYKEKTAYLWDVSPLYMLVTLAMFSVLCHVGRIIRGEKLKRMISFGAKHSFSVYLIHMMVLQPLLETLGAKIMQVGGMLTVAGHVLITVIALTFSLLLAAFFDETVLRAIRKVYFGLPLALPHKPHD